LEKILLTNLGLLVQKQFSFQGMWKGILVQLYKKICPIYGVNALHGLKVGECMVQWLNSKRNYTLHKFIQDSLK